MRPLGARGEARPVSRQLKTQQQPRWAADSPAAATREQRPPAALTRRWRRSTWSRWMGRRTGWVARSWVRGCHWQGWRQLGEVEPRAPRRLDGDSRQGRPGQGGRPGAGLVQSEPAAARMRACRKEQRGGSGQDIRCAQTWRGRKAWALTDATRRARRSRDGVAQAEVKMATGVSSGPQPVAGWAAAPRSRCGSLRQKA